VVSHERGNTACSTLLSHAPALNPTSRKAKSHLETSTMLNPMHLPPKFRGRLGCTIPYRASLTTELYHTQASGVL
jgi:hypothetical protein